jgi:cobalt-zinc-cadmium efflux system protein
VERIEREILAEPNIKGVHDTHIWSLDGENHILTTHIVFDKTVSQKEAISIKCKVKKAMERLGIQHATIEIEIEGEECNLECA